MIKCNDKVNDNNLKSKAHRESNLNSLQLHGINVAVIELVPGHRT
jgi:hypothetical protein